MDRPSSINLSRNGLLRNIALPSIMRNPPIASRHRLAYTAIEMRSLIAIGLCSVLGALAVPSGAFADNFADAHYDASTDELVVTMRYSGTNPDHNFSVQWGACTDSNDDSGVQRVDATIEDDQWRDAARELFKKTIRVSLAQLACRPVVLTIHTAPRFYYTLRIPAARQS